MKHHRPVTVYHAAAICDADGLDARPGAIAISQGRIVAAGHVNDLPRWVAREGRRVDLPDRLLLPAMVNGHAHLDLTHLGPRPYVGNFVDWLAQVMQGRPGDDAAIAASVQRGVELSRQAGVEWVGDVANSPAAIRTRQDAGLAGVSYLECFGLGKRQDQRIEDLRRQLDSLEFETPVAGHVRGTLLGISPHAPTTAGPRIFEEATRLSENHAYRLCTHAAETPEEIEFLAAGTGPWRDHLERLGVLDEDFQPPGRHPLDYLEDELRRGRWLLAHCNYVADDHIDLLKRTGTSVVYCPVASDYFGHPLKGGHRYRDMLEAGVNVCLGTDSIVCQSPGADQPMSILAQMRHLYRRDRCDPRMLLSMATTRGALALDLAEREVTLRTKAPATFCSIPIDPDDETHPLIQALLTDAPVTPIRDI